MRFTRIEVGNFALSTHVVSAVSRPRRRCANAALLAGACAAGLGMAHSARGQNLTWVGDGVTNPWDFSTPDWSNGGVASVYTDGSTVTFDDTGLARNIVNLA